MESADSSTVTESTRSQMPADTMIEHVGEPRVDAAPEDRRAPVLARVDDAGAPVAERVAGDERRGAHDVDARLEDPHHLVDVGPLRVVDDAVGPQREQRVDVVGGEDPERFDPAQLADVAPDLVGPPGVATDELQAGVGRDGDDRPSADVARRPLDDAERWGVGGASAHAPGP